MTIGERIKLLRRQNDLTQERVAEYLSVSSQAVSKWECGLACPDLALILPLSRILHVSADELLGGTTEETDARCAELDELYKNSWKYNNEEMYQTAKQAVSEYPGNYKYLLWLARMESVMNMYERSIQHSNIVIEECTDSDLRNEAIWNSMVCHRTLGQYDEALKYAEMFPEQNYHTRGNAMLMCLQDEELQKHKQWMVYSALANFCVSLTEIYRFEKEKTPQVTAALDLKEAVLKTVFNDGNFLSFYTNMCFLYEKRAELELSIGNHEKAMEYLYCMVDYAKKYTELCNGEFHRHTCDVFNLICEQLDITVPYRPFICNGDSRNTKPVMEQIKIALTTEEQFAPLRERDDFRRLLEL